MKNTKINYRILTQAHVMFGNLYVILYTGYPPGDGYLFGGSNIFVELKPHYYDWIKENMKINDDYKSGSFLSDWVAVEKKWGKWKQLVYKDPTYKYAIHTY